MREDANGRAVSASPTFLAVKRRQFKRAALNSLHAAGRADQAGDTAASDRAWARYEQANTLALRCENEIRAAHVEDLKDLAIGAVA